jgi:YD repeat-containing protein
MVQLFSGPACAGVPSATGTAADLGWPRDRDRGPRQLYDYNPRLQPTTTTHDYNSTTTLRATATDVAGKVSGCSPSGLTFVETTPPPSAEPTTPTPTTSGTPTSPPGDIPPQAPQTTAPDTPYHQAPHALLTLLKRTVRISFRFTSHPAGGVFKCRMDSGRFQTCKSPQSYLVKAGRHAFAVKAIRGGVADPTPATFRSRVAPAKKQLDTSRPRASRMAKAGSNRRHHDFQGLPKRRRLSGKSLQYAYDAAGDLVSVTDPVGDKTARPTTPWVGASARPRPGGMPPITSTTPPDGSPRQLSTDDLGRRRQRAEPDRRCRPYHQLLLRPSEPEGLVHRLVCRENHHAGVGGARRDLRDRLPRAAGNVVDVGSTESARAPGGAGTGAFPEEA